MYKKSLIVTISILGIVGCSPIVDLTNGTADGTSSTPSSSTSTSTGSSSTDNTSSTSTNTNNTSTTTNSADTLSYINPFTKQSYLDAINKARGTGRTCEGEGYFGATSALSWNDNLYKASIEHSQDMATSNTFSHTGSNTSSDLSAKALNLGRGSSMSDRIDYNGYTNWKNAGENIAAGNSTLEATINQWLTSGGHCANIMNPNFTEVGMSHAENSSSSYRHYWTQTFGARF